MKCFGQVIMTYRHGNKQWITIWDLEEQRSFDVADREEPALNIGQLVSFNWNKSVKNELHCISEVKTIGRKQLPSHLKPLLK